MHIKYFRSESLELRTLAHVIGDPGVGHRTAQCLPTAVKELSRYVNPARTNALVITYFPSYFRVLAIRYIKMFIFPGLLISYLKTPTKWEGLEETKQFTDEE
jgi:hypothetical protein